MAPPPSWKCPRPLTVHRQTPGVLPKVLLTRRSLESLAESHPVRYYSVVSSRPFLVGCPADSKPIVAIEFCYRHIPCCLCLPLGRRLRWLSSLGCTFSSWKTPTIPASCGRRRPRRGMLVVAAAGF